MGEKSTSMKYQPLFPPLGRFREKCLGTRKLGYRLPFYLKCHRFKCEELRVKFEEKKRKEKKSK